MSQCEDIDACHKFISEIVPFIPPIRQIRILLVDYTVSSDELVIKVTYDKKLFEHRIDQFVRDIIKEAQRSRLLHKYNWAVNRPLVEEIEESDSCFQHTVVIIITGN